MGHESGLDGRVMGEETGFPFIYSHVYKTPQGTPYLRAPGVHLIGKPNVNLQSLDSFFAGFDPDLGFRDYNQDPDDLDPGAKLVKFEGQLCYASFGSKRTKNKDAAKYMTHIKESAHGSVANHAVYNFFIYGISRSVSHELIRHAAGTGVSQLSQRYVSGKVLRFVERPEYQTDPVMHAHFEQGIDWFAKEYEFRAEHLAKRQAEGDTSLTADRKTDLRKKVQQAARSVLPNETETFLGFTGNVRAWRHMIEMRAAPEADIEIREVLVRVYKILKTVSPILFDDYSFTDISDGTMGVTTPYRKI